MSAVTPDRRPTAGAFTRVMIATHEGHVLQRRSRTLDAVLAVLCTAVSIAAAMGATAIAPSIWAFAVTLLVSMSLTGLGAALLGSVVR